MMQETSGVTVTKNRLDDVVCALVLLFVLLIFDDLEPPHMQTTTVRTYSQAYVTFFFFERIPHIESLLVDATKNVQIKSLNRFQKIKYRTNN